MLNALKVHNNLTIRIAKKLVVVLFVMAITLVTAGCSPKPVEAIESPTTANTPVSPEPKQAPVPHVETKSPRELELEALLEKAPEIPGLTKSISENKIVYNNEQGEYSGYYVVKAYYNGEETDGVSLSIDVIIQLINQKQEEGPNTSFSLPVDPSEGQVVSVEFQQEMIKGSHTVKNGYFYISSETPVNVINSFADNQKIMRFMSSFERGGGANNESIFVVNNENNPFSGAIALHLIKSSFINPKIILSQPYTLYKGEIIGQMQGTLILERSIASWDDFDKYFAYESNLLKIKEMILYTGDNDTFLSSTVKDLLMIDDTPVFINTIQSRTE